MNKRLSQFDDAISSVPDGASHWTDVARDPNAPLAIAFRAKTLRAVWRDPISDRADFIVERSIGRRVLDVGCVAHDIERMKSPQWLHRRVSDAAKSCVGVDILANGIAQMRALGFNAVEHDLSSGLGPLGQMDPFDVIVAGELIEHVSDLDMLFKAAHGLMHPGGELILTTPNPYAPRRVQAGQRGDCWENTDHIVYAFPSGIAELADRNGLALAEAATTTPERRTPARLKDVVRAGKRRLKGSTWVHAGIATLGSPRTVRLPVLPYPSLGARRSARFVGETFIYVIRHRQGTADG